jgi:phosphoglycolate phosphatase-like HAD superfamily hydrolase
VSDPASQDWAIIFDVDGVLLELKRAEEELFFEPFARRMDASNLSRDWNSYRLRNDEEIVKEIVARCGWPASEAATIKQEYLDLLARQIHARKLVTAHIAGAAALIETCTGLARLGIATANFRRAAELRLLQAQMWSPVTGLAFGADGGGHKADILKRAVAASGLPQNRIIFIGDNVNDVAAGLGNGVHFIGFSTDERRLPQLQSAGASLLASHHGQTLAHIKAILGA